MNPFFRKIATTAVPITVPEVVRATAGIYRRNEIERFEQDISQWLGLAETVLVNKGTTALYLILKAMRKLRPDRDEVIYPAYTVPTLKLAFDQIGLKTRVCDISRSTFNMDPQSLKGELSDKTLAVLPVHMFGFPMRIDGIEELTGDDIFVVEDCAQAPGAKLEGKLAGTFAPSAIFSLCKGKNISTYTGGFAAFKDRELAQLARNERAELDDSKGGIKMAVMLAAFALAMRPGVYGPLFPFIKGFKSEEVHTHFDALRFTSVQAALGRIILSKLDRINAQRRTNGMFLYEALKDNEHILLPEIIPGAEPVFNHLPVVFLNADERERSQRRLWEKGIDTARMYMHPNHHIYDLGYPREAFPNSIEIAEGLVTMPTHSFVTQRDLDLIVDIVSKP